MYVRLHFCLQLQANPSQKIFFVKSPDAGFMSNHHISQLDGETCLDENVIKQVITVISCKVFSDKLLTPKLNSFIGLA